MFDVDADAYDRFMGRFSIPLAPFFADAAGIAPGQRLLDVGCGPGALTVELAARLGSPSVAAVDPSGSFVAAVKQRLPEVEVQQAPAESLPYEDALFDAAMAQLVVHFMADPVAGLAEMGRVTRPGGVVAACVWDHAGGTGPLSPFWAGVADVDPQAPTEAALPGSSAGQLTALARDAGLTEPVESRLTVTIRCATFEEWWAPMLLRVGPAGVYLAGLDEIGRAAVRDACRRRLPDPPFEVSASAWCVVARPGHAPGRLQPE